MGRLFGWTTIVLLAGLLIAAFVLGPGRLYGLAGSRVCAGKVAKIQPYGESTKEIPNTFLVEMHGEDRQVYLFASSDCNWLMVQAGDEVRARLYPSAPWSQDVGHWQNASLVAKVLAEPTGEEAKAEESKSDAPAPAAKVADAGAVAK